MTIYIQKSDWGTRNPFVARMYLGILEIRNYLAMASNDPRRKPFDSRKFDNCYEKMRISMETILRNSLEISRLLKVYGEDLDKGEVVKNEGGHFVVKKSIDRDLDQQFGNIINQSVIIIKSGLQKLLKDACDLDFSFFFQKEKIFREGISQLKNDKNEDLSDFLINAREKWWSEVNELRHQREHENWHLEELKISSKYPMMKISLPEISHIPVSLYSKILVNRVIFFVESLIAYGFQQDPFSLIKLQEIPIYERDPSCPLRFRASNPINKGDIWKLEYKEISDFQ